MICYCRVGIFKKISILRWLPASIFGLNFGFRRVSLMALRRFRTKTIETRFIQKCLLLGCDHIEGIWCTLYDLLSTTDEIPLLPRYITWMSSIAESKLYSV